MTPEMLITLTAGRSVQPFIVPGSGRPYWTVAEAGQACANLEPEILAAMLYSYAGATDGFQDEDAVPKTLRQRLSAFGQAMRSEMQWVTTVPHTDGPRGEYFDELAEIALLEERQPWRFRTPNEDGSMPVGRPATISPFYLALARVGEGTWRKQLHDPYAALRWRYITWLSIGKSHMRRWMRSHVERLACA